MTQVTTETAMPNEPSLPALQQLIWDSLLARRAKTISPAEANADANLSGKYMSTLKLQLDMLRLANKQPDATLLTRLGLALPPGDEKAPPPA